MGLTLKICWKVREVLLLGMEVKSYRLAGSIVTLSLSKRRISKTRILEKHIGLDKKFNFLLIERWISQPTKAGQARLNAKTRV
jgi:hypothetical protein